MLRIEHNTCYLWTGSYIGLDESQELKTLKAFVKRLYCLSDFIFTIKLLPNSHCGQACRNGNLIPTYTSSSSSTEAGHKPQKRFFYYFCSKSPSLVAYLSGARVASKVYRGKIYIFIFNEFSTYQQNRLTAYKN